MKTFYFVSLDQFPSILVTISQSQRPSKPSKFNVKYMNRFVREGLGTSRFWNSNKLAYIAINVHPHVGTSVAHAGGCVPVCSAFHCRRCVEHERGVLIRVLVSSFQPSVSQFLPTNSSIYI